ncbi:MAG: hypothetical protein ACRD4K_17085 [Candidatus Acidiferrales bacterium]
MDRDSSTVSAGPGGKEQKGGTQALAATGAQVGSDFANRLNCRTILLGNFLFDQEQVIAHQLKHFLGR